MKKSPQVPALFRVLLPILCLILLLASPAVAVAGAAQGLLLWFNVVLPTLAPFLICTRAVSASGGLSILMRPFAPLLRRLFGLDREGSYVLLCGLLCGYPLGAKLCADFYADGSVSREEAQYLLAICNHPSPMFLLGYVLTQLGNAVSPVLLLTCLYLPVLPLSLLARSCYHVPDSGICSGDAPGEPVTENGSTTAVESASPGKSAAPGESLDEILMSACETMVMIGGYIMLFSILAAWIRQLHFLPLPLQTALSGAAEITTGVHQICSTLPPRKAVLPTLLCVAFGGCSGLFQTRSVIARQKQRLPDKKESCCAGVSYDTKNAGLSIRHYLVWKLLHAALTGAACILLTALQ